MCHHLYVDDMLIFGTSLKVVCETKKFLRFKFDMKDLARKGKGGSRNQHNQNT